MQSPSSDFTFKRAFPFADKTTGNSKVFIQQFSTLYKERGHFNYDIFLKSKFP